MFLSNRGSFRPETSGAYTLRRRGRRRPKSGSAIGACAVARLAGSGGPIGDYYGSANTVGEDLEEELRPVGDGQLAAVEDGAGGRVERAAAGQAAPPAHAVGVAPVALDRRRAAARARVAVVAVEEIGLADQAGARVAVAVHVAVAVPDDPLGRGQLAVAGAVPRRGRRRRAPPLLFSAHGGSPRCPEGRRRRGLPHRKSIAVHPGGLADGCSVACDYRATRAAADALPTFCKGGFKHIFQLWNRTCDRCGCLRPATSRGRGKALRGSRRPRGCGRTRRRWRFGCSDAAARRRTPRTNRRRAR